MKIIIIIEPENAKILQLHDFHEKQNNPYTISSFTTLNSHPGKDE